MPLMPLMQVTVGLALALPWITTGFYTHVMQGMDDTFVTFYSKSISHLGHAHNLH